MKEASKVVVLITTPEHRCLPKSLRWSKGLTAMISLR